MLARLIIPALFLTSTAFADCLPDPAVVEAIQSVRDNPCFQLHEWCLDRQLEDIDRLLEERPDSMVLHRLRQDLWLAANADQLETARDELLDHYRNHPALEPDGRRYLVARMMRDEPGLRQAVEDFPWARLDLIQRRFEADGDALVEQDEARQLLEGFVAECPDASVLLAAEASQLLISARWPVWGKVRRHLLDMETPPWDRLGVLLIRAGLLQDDEGSPAERLIAELKATAGEDHGDEAGYWLYRARIHLVARDLDAALEANEKARKINPCMQLPPMQRHRPVGPERIDRQLFEAVSKEILDCPPDKETYQFWLMGANFLADESGPEQVPPDTLARVRSAIDSHGLDGNTARMERMLTTLDILVGYETDSAWRRLSREFESSRQRLAQMRESGTGTENSRTSLAASQIRRAWYNARLGLKAEQVDKAEEWLEIGDRLFRANRSKIEKLLFEFVLENMRAIRSEIDWLKARSESRHADAVVYALSARAEGLDWIEMDEVAASWRAAGGTEEGFEHLLAAWDLDLPAKWRGWRRLGEPLEAFELADRQGRTWTPADFEGKRTLLNLWAVWCGPCMIELPKVQELHERYRDNPDVQVVTVNMDSVEGVAREIMEREGWDFPVLMRSSDDTAFEQVAIPRNWLVDDEGVRQWEQTGFTPQVAEYWVADIVSLLERME